MSELALQDIAEMLLRGAREHGATAADVVVAEGDSLAVGVRLGSVEKVQVSVALPLVIAPWEQTPDHWIVEPLSAPA